MDALTLLLLSDMAKDLMPFAGMVLVVAGLFMILRKRRHRSHLRESPLEKAERYQQQSAMRGDLESVMVEVEQLARRFSNQLDAKSIQLESLLRQADEKIAQLEAIGEKSTPGTPGTPHQEMGGFAVEIPPGSPSPNPKPQASSLPPDLPPEDELTQGVYHLADDGCKPADIAKKLDEHVGKIELILALRK